jgi:hypothetical protein
MLYMNILTWDPAKRDEVMERAQTKGFAHEGIKVLGTWADVQGSRSFQLTKEPDDPKLSLKANFEWNDIMKIDSVRVMEAEELFRIIGSMK